MLFLGIRFFYIGAAKEIIGTDIVKISKFYNSIHRIIQNTNFILRIGILADSQMFCNLFLRIAIINPYTSDIFIFHHFITHIITQ